MTTITTIVLTPAHMTLVKVDRVQTHTSTVDGVRGDSLMVSRIRGLAPVWPGSGENGDRHACMKSLPHGRYLGQF